MSGIAWIAAVLAAHAPPIPAPEPGSANLGDTVVYVVKPGETLGSIADRGLIPGSGVAKVQRLNHIGNDRAVPIGFHLVIPRAFLKTAPILARVDGFHGAASVIAGGPKALSVGRMLGEGAVLATGENAYVRLGLPDGTHLSIPSNSRVRLDLLREVVLTGSVDRQVSVQAGGLDSQVIPMTNPSSRYVVVTPVAQSSVRGTEFHVAYDPAHSSVASGTLKGVVATANAKAEVEAAAGQGAVATPQGVKGPIPLLPAPSLEAASKVQTGQTLHFALTPVAGAAHYHLAIAADAKVEAPIYETTSDSPHIEAPNLADGRWFARVTAISADGLEGLPAIVPFDRAKGDLTIVGAARGGDGAVEFRWEAPGDPPPTYRFTLARGDDLNHPLVSTDLAEAHYRAADLSPGDYVWRVSARRTTDGRRTEIVSDPQPLHVP